MRETIVTEGERGEINIPYDTADGSVTHFTIQALEAESLVVTVFAGAAGKVTAERFRRWLQQPGTWTAFENWTDGMEGAR